MAATKQDNTKDTQQHAAQEAAPVTPAPSPSVPLTSLAAFKAAGAVVDAAPVPRDIRWTLHEIEYTATVHVRRLAIGEYEDLVHDINDERSKTAAIISRFITLGEHGDEAIPYKEAYRLEPVVANAMLGAFNEVNAEKKSDAHRGTAA